ncbi:hypothetical protein PIB30_059398 [Stylosanthes scabra]|uniref:Uncharacterized protein n=1 Tax=Stylosanthes scabra TaxID=79078 RepID=A0ABU6VIP3_9FABA|nr:hypothetical protein [Stylosanthes scabra]
MVGHSLEGSDEGVVVGISGFVSFVVDYRCKFGSVRFFAVAEMDPTGSVNCRTILEHSTACSGVVVAKHHRNCEKMQPYYPLVTVGIHLTLGVACCPSLISFSIETILTKDLARIVDSDGATSNTPLAEVVALVLNINGRSFIDEGDDDDGILFELCSFEILGRCSQENRTPPENLQIGIASSNGHSSATIAVRAVARSHGNIAATSGGGLDTTGETRQKRPLLAASP